MEQHTPPQQTNLPPQIVGAILSKMEGLPVRYIPEVEHFIDFLKQRHKESETGLTEGYFQLSAEVWDDE